jgi:Arc/MetJ family transcription regulator
MSPMSTGNPLQYKGTGVVDVPALRSAPAAAARAGSGTSHRRPGAFLMAKTLIDIDDELLERARPILGTATKKDTVNAALREVVRRWAAQEFGELARSGVFDALLAAHAGQSPIEPVER